jgi:hypothetical protein
MNAALPDRIAIFALGLSGAAHGQRFRAALSAAPLDGPRYRAVTRDKGCDRVTARVDATVIGRR